MTDYPLTFKCNNNCISCILNTKFFFKLKDPPIENIKDAIDNSEYICFGGGEPTLRKEMFEILEYTRKKYPDKFIFLTTNGRMFYYEDFVRRLAGLKLFPKSKNEERDYFRIAIPLYGHTADIHEKITTVINSFKQTVVGIKNLLKYDFPVELRIIISKINYKQLENIADFVAREFPGVERVTLINMKYTGNALKNKNRLFVKYKDIVPEAEKAVEVLLKNEIDVRMFHFPLCTISKKYRSFAKGVTKQEIELRFVDECERCRMKEECPRIWKSYVSIAGAQEFKAIRGD